MGSWIRLRDADMREGYYGGWCLSYVQDAFHTDHPYSSAIDSWNANYGNGNHPGEVPPLGMTVPVYFSLGNVPAGHVAIRLDDGMVASSTLGPINSFHAVPYYHPDLNNLITMYGEYNGGCNYLGWSQYVGTTKVVAWQDQHIENHSEPIPFTIVNENDNTLPVGQTAIKQAGVNGVHNWADTVITLDGIEQSRSRTSDTTTPAINQITLVGTFIPEVKPEDPPIESNKPSNPDIPDQANTPITPVTPVNNENNAIRLLVKIIQFIIQNLKNIFKEKK